MTEQEVIARLQAAVNEAGSLRAFGAKHGFGAAYLSDVLRRKRAPADRICQAIGIERKVVHTTRYSDKLNKADV